MLLSINDSAIIWPGDSKVKPAGFMIPTHLRVLTIEEVPFVFVRRVLESSECDLDEEPCPHFNTTDSCKITEYFCEIDFTSFRSWQTNFSQTLMLHLQ